MDICSGAFWMLLKVNSPMKLIKRISILLAVGSVVSCASQLPEDSRPVSAVYCDNFLVYDMCVQDLNGDGVVEYVYFTDSKEIFLLREGVDQPAPAALTMHKCVQFMSESLLRTTSRMLYIDESTSLLEKSDIRGALMVKYIALMPEVTACNLQAEDEQTIALESRDKLFTE